MAARCVPERREGRACVVHGPPPSPVPHLPSRARPDRPSLREPLMALPMMERASDWPSDGSLPPHAQAAVDWLCTPPSERAADEKSQSAWCVKHGFHYGAITQWKRDRRFQVAWQKRADEVNMSTDRIQRVIESIHKAAVGGDMKAAALYMQFANMMAPKRIVVEDKTLAGMSDAQLRNELAASGLLVGAE